MTRRRTLSSILVAAAMFLAAPGASAFTHVARTDETLSDLATQYYGSADKAMVIRAANGFMHPDDGSLIQGEHVNVPGIVYHRVASGEDWYSISAQYLGTAKRGRFLAELNENSPDSVLEAGKIVKVPYQLLYILAPDESIKTVAKMFLSKTFDDNWLREYNLKRKKKYGHGDALLVPLISVEFTPEARAIIQQKAETEASEKDHEVQEDATRQIAAIKASYETGHYVVAVGMAQQLIGTDKLTNPQKIGVYKYLAFSYAAFDELDLVRLALLEALKLQPAMELSPMTTSPKILAIFQELQGKANK